MKYLISMTLVLSAHLNALANEQEQPAYSDCLEMICVGMNIIDDDQRKSTVLSINPSADYPYLLKREDERIVKSSIEGLFVMDEDFCHRGVCVGDHFYEQDHYRERVILAISIDNHYHVYDQGVKNGQFYWSQLQVMYLTTEGLCKNSICLGDRVISTNHNNEESTVIGIAEDQFRGSFLLQADDGDIRANLADRIFKIQ